MSPEEIDDRYVKLITNYTDYLEKFSVKLPSKDSYKTLWLIYLSKYENQLVHKDTIAKFVKTVYPKAGNDQQIRHLAGDGWYVLNTGEDIPRSNEKVPQGYHLLYDLKSPKPSFIHSSLKRQGRLAAKDFEQLKAVYNFCCATCGMKEGKRHRWSPDKVVKLQKGHMNPRKKLDIDNTIPQCQLCNQQYKDYFVFDGKGRISKINSPKIVMMSDEQVKKDIFKCLGHIYT